MAHRTKLTIRVREKFLEHLRQTANVSEACLLIGVKRRSVYDCRERDEAFRRAWDEAIEIATDALEREARRRAIEGVETPVFYRGDCVGTVLAYSDRMLELLLKAHRPDKYSERVQLNILVKHQVESEIERIQKDVGLTEAEKSELIQDIMAYAYGN
jgi:hypothetical protein